MIILLSIYKVICGVKRGYRWERNPFKSWLSSNLRELEVNRSHGLADAPLVGPVVELSGGGHVT